MFGLGLCITASAEHLANKFRLIKISLNASIYTKIQYVFMRNLIIPPVWIRTFYSLLSRIMPKMK